MYCLMLQYSCIVRGINGTTTIQYTVGKKPALKTWTHILNGYLDGAAIFKRIQIPYLISQGYTNLRCVWLLGCPAELKFDQPGTPEQTTQTEYPQAFMELFPGQTLPSAIGVACCAQFAVTRETIRSRPREEYEQWRQWILNAPLPNDISGRIFEYSWHFIFGKAHVHCPSAQHCYCSLYGLCDLECEGEKGCGERWPYPPFSTLPDGWPTKGWNSEIRGEEELDRLRDVAIRLNRTASWRGYYRWNKCCFCRESKLLAETPWRLGLVAKPRG